MSYIVRNCPALSYGRTKFKKCYRTGWKQNCQDCSDCIIKQIYEKFKECSCELINFLEIEEIDEQL